MWRTLQDRLIGELRLHAITTRSAANAFLPLFIADYNRRFARPPVDPTPAWRRPPRDLPLLLSCRYTRTVAPDNTVRLGPRWLQLPPGPGGRSFARSRIELRECLDGRLVALRNGRILATAAAPAAEFVLAPRAHPSHARAAQRRPAPAADRAASHESPRTRVSLAALTALAHALRHPARQHPWRRGFAARQQVRARVRAPEGG